jgi:hypothetical protein
VSSSCPLVADKGPATHVPRPSNRPPTPTSSRFACIIPPSYTPSRYADNDSKLLQNGCWSYLRGFALQKLFGKALVEVQSSCSSLDQALTHSDLQTASLLQNVKSIALARRSSPTESTLTPRNVPSLIGDSKIFRLGPTNHYSSHGCS